MMIVGNIPPHTYTLLYGDILLVILPCVVTHSTLITNFTIREEGGGLSLGRESDPFV